METESSPERDVIALDLYTSTAGTPDVYACTDQCWGSCSSVLLSIPALNSAAQPLTEPFLLLFIVVVAALKGLIRS